MHPGPSHYDHAVIPYSHPSQRAEKLATNSAAPGSHMPAQEQHDCSLKGVSSIPRKELLGQIALMGTSHHTLSMLVACMVTPWPVIMNAGCNA